MLCQHRQIFRERAGAACGGERTGEEGSALPVKVALLDVVRVLEGGVEAGEEGIL